jgi:flagellar hook assembly protein FlgD
VTLVVLDANGTVVRSLQTNAAEPAGTQTIMWNGTDDNGNVVADGTYTIRVDATDSAGLTAATQFTTVTVDTMTPTPPANLALATDSNSGSLGDNTTNVTTPTIIGTAEPGTTITVFNNGTAVGTTTTNAVGNWSFTFGTPLPDGSYVLTAKASDAAGNSTAASAPLTITIDTQPPVISNVSVSANPFSVSTQGSTTLSYTLSESATATVVVLDGSGNVVKSLVGPITETGSNQSVSWDGTDDSFNVVADGTYTFRIDAMDAAGNAAVTQFATVQKIA